MSSLFPWSPTHLAGQQTPQPGGVFLDPATAYVNKFFARPLRAEPIPRDPKLPIGHPDQTYTDCRTIEGWTDTIARLMRAAWGFSDQDDSFRFGHSYGLLPNDPKHMKGVVIVYEILSMVPGTRGKSGVERKPLLREVVPDPTLAATLVEAQVVQGGGLHAGDTVALSEGAEPQSAGRTWIYAQRFDAVVRFMIYSDNWDRAIEFCDRTYDLITTYTGLFKQAGLQNLWFSQQGQDILHDPPRVQEFPNRTLIYKATVERVTRVNYAQIEQILIRAGVINPGTGSVDQVLVTAVEGTAQTPILPTTDPEHVSQ